jgi:CRP-like cAMP-binding protein
MDGVADDTRVRQALRACGLFGAASDEVLDALVGVLRIRRFRRGETVFHQADPGDALFIVASGSVKVVLPSDEGPEPAIVAILGSGEFFGELAILDGAPHSATIVAVEPTEALVLRRDAFLGLIDSDPELRRALLASLAGEIRRLTGHVEDLHFLDLPGRLASRILRLAAHQPVTPEGVRIAWPYTQSELAGMIGGSRQSVNRLLADLTDQGLVRLERDHLVVADVDALARTVDR